MKFLDVTNMWIETLTTKEPYDPYKDPAGHRPGYVIFIYSSYMD